MAWVKDYLTSPNPFLPQTGRVSPQLLEAACKGTYLEGFCLRAQPLGAEFHHRIGAKRVPDSVLTHGEQPQGGIGFQLRGRDEDGLVPGVHTAERHRCSVRAPARRRAPLFWARENVKQSVSLNHPESASTRNSDAAVVSTCGRVTEPCQASRSHC